MPETPGYLNEYIENFVYYIYLVMLESAQQYTGC
jgi:hypothetical protein